MRKAIKRFASRMEKKLTENDHKAHWSGCDPLYLLSRLKEEVMELTTAIHQLDEQDIIDEAVDVANFAMMIADNHCAIDASVEKATESGDLKMTERIAELTPEQIENWRKALCLLIGPYALIMPERDIIKFRNKMQSRIDSEELLKGSDND